MFVNVVCMCSMKQHSYCNVACTCLMGNILNVPCFRFSGGNTSRGFNMYKRQHWNVQSNSLPLAWLDSPRTLPETNMEVDKPISFMFLVVRMLRS